MKEKDIFHRSRFSEQDIAELFLSHEMNPKLTSLEILIKMGGLNRILLSFKHGKTLVMEAFETFLYFDIYFEKKEP